MKKGWEIKDLCKICEVFLDGDWIESKDQSLGGIRLIQTGNVGNGYFKDRKEKARYISEETFIKLKCTEVIEGDCLISRLPDPVGRACIVPKTKDKMITAVDCTIVRFDLKKINPIYFNYYSQSKQYLDDVKNEITGTTRNRISKKSLGKIQIPMPRLPEQQRIVELLDETFEVISRLKEIAEKNLKNSREIFDSYLQNVFSNPGVSWKERKFGEVYDVRDGTHDSPKYHEKGYALITSKNLKNDSLNYDRIKYISELDYKKINQRSKVEKGDILFAMIGTIGNPVVIEHEPDFAIKNVALFKIPNEQSSYFLKYYLDSRLVVNKMLRDAKGTTQKFVGLGYLREFKITLPPIHEQTLIVDKIESISAETKKLEAIYRQKLDSLEELKKSILQKAFNGEL